MSAEHQTQPSEADRPVNEKMADVLDEFARRLRAGVNDPELRAAVVRAIEEYAHDLRAKAE